MEEELQTLVFSHSLPVFGVECFGSALVDDGRFSRAVGLAPAPPVVRYSDGKWLVEKHWLVLARHQLNAQHGAWVSSFVDVSERHAERIVSSFDVGGSPEHVANGLCDLYGAMAAPMLVFTLLEELLEQRIKKLFERAGIPADQEDAWLGVFRYPEKKTEAMKEHEAFFSLAAFVRRHAMDRTTRFSYDKVNRLTGKTDAEGFVTRFGYDAVGNLGLITPAARKLTFTDMLHRASRFEEEPAAMRAREGEDRTRVLERAQAFMNNMGLHAADRDAIRAYRDTAYWHLREKELLALLETAMAPGIGRLSTYLNLSFEQLTAMRVEELSSALANPKDTVPSFDLDHRLKKKFSALFVEDLIEPHWD